MFTHTAIANLNALELMIYNYVIKNKDKVMYMTIRELADAADVSTTTVMRFCKKMGCDGYSEFRIRFKLSIEQEIHQPVNFGVGEIVSFFNSINNKVFEELINQAVIHIANADRIVFVGAGSSGSLGKYGARFFSNVGKFSNYIDDPYYPVSTDTFKNSVAIILSVSGETQEILRLASQFNLHACKVISITNSETCSLARMADFNLSYHMPQTVVSGRHNITTQVPVIYILEAIAHRLAKIHLSK
ncbi:MurR/RpiR family transcriptional regulator [Pragia fontium]|uniref:MurR/RpiR family transcriptional regulator n=1 Tax=Pragia fontium TaxID=82985 RepID=UPI0006493B7D|nr:MurR/RpiR family transcriptional regulator [Pragia fontium]AKJ41643.1 transcriptional regulator [Pragia fontium]